MRRLIFLSALAILAPRDARAHEPPPPSAWTAGLDEGATHAPTRGIQVLRPSPGGRVRIPAGTFMMGASPAQMAQAIELCEREIDPSVRRLILPEASRCHARGFIMLVRAEGSAHPVTLSAFDMDREEVSVAEYARCASAGVCAPADLGADPRFSRPDLPATHVSFEDAAQYCHWVGGRLPTEAEWEYAARGASGRLFPWGDVYNPHLANHGSDATDPTDASDGFEGLAPVGSFPDGATPLGLLDMAGNAAEWVADLLEVDKAGDAVGYPEDPVNDPPAHTSGGGPHIIRGGSYEDSAPWLRATSRNYTLLARSPWVGFRCAADAR